MRESPQAATSMDVEQTREHLNKAIRALDEIFFTIGSMSLDEEHELNHGPLKTIVRIYRDYGGSKFLTTLADDEIPF